MRLYSQNKLIDLAPRCVHQPTSTLLERVCSQTRFTACVEILSVALISRSYQPPSFIRENNLGSRERNAHHGVSLSTLASVIYRSVSPTRSLAAGTRPWSFLPRARSSRSVHKHCVVAATLYPQLFGTENVQANVGGVPRPPTRLRAVLVVGPAYPAWSGSIVRSCARPRATSPERDGRLRKRMRALIGACRVCVEVLASLYSV